MPMPHFALQPTLAVDSLRVDTEAKLIFRVGPGGGDDLRTLLAQARADSALETDGRAVRAVAESVGRGGQARLEALTHIIAQARASPALETDGRAV
eukprot:CAMPEP_0181196472 /NCGR_PEP_ID=MMETSP1096-20121128/15485_1 /TAXON_ID=156174 ORGANISM="Chrysochromulina ericina, Strain CCMP281" /NCGR_SAMPLE_ID=MMETSP1096 /ASSEMBLY_ACC=CAM_ASM_000453 /LENGTH=95 /DNA_ID=CAMNT_0023286237 /DNA_START=431 /DNA_END=719 /DNA_ORIENTATION=+